jgi:hypothetical protein
MDERVGEKEERVGSARAEGKGVIAVEGRITRPQRGAGALVIRVYVRIGAIALWRFVVSCRFGRARRGIAAH